MEGKPSGGASTVKVYLMDGSYKSMTFAKKETVADVWLRCCEKMNLSSDGAECFFFWAYCDTLELLLYSDSFLSKVVRQWPKTYVQYHYKKKGLVATWDKVSKLAGKVHAPDMNLLFRVLPLSVERNIKDRAAVHLFYIQAVRNVIESNYPCEPELAASLAGLQLQLALGDNKGDLHKPPYLRKDMAVYVPQHLKSKMNSTEWEEKIWEQHRSHTGKDSLIVELLYLQLVRQWPYYGSTFFRAEYIPSTNSHYRQPFEGEVRVGVNMNGIHIIDPKRMKMDSYSFPDLQRWAAEGNVFGFLTPKGEIKKHWYKTPQAELINDLLYDIVEEHRLQKEKITTLRRRQEGRDEIRSDEVIIGDEDSSDDQPTEEGEIGEEEEEFWAQADASMRRRDNKGKGKLNDYREENSYTMQDYLHGTHPV